VAIGFRAHSGWACAIIVAGNRKDIGVVERRRVELCDPRIDGSKQPFHHAEPMRFSAAKAYIARCTRATDRLADEAVAALRACVEEDGIAGACIITASERKLPDLAGILASHALIHAAEGEFYRDALARGLQRAALEVSRVKEKDTLVWTASRLGTNENALRERLAAIGKPLGPPWGSDEKLATMAGWLVLAG
jgi:hypothetical protein